MTRIAGRVAVVTGGASGIGRAIAEALRDAGATVVIADIQAAPLAEVAAALGVDSVVVDVRDSASVQRLADTVVGRHGGVGILVNNAGVGGIGRIEDLGIEDWRRLIDVNLWGAIHGITAFLPILRSNPDGGHVLNTGSMASFVADEGLGAYTVAKYGVAGLTETLALELAGTGIGVTLLAPGTVRSNFGREPAEWTAEPDAGEAALDGLPDGLAARLRSISPAEAAHVALRAIEDNRLYAPTHPEWWRFIEPRFAAIRDSFEPLLEET